MPASDPLRLAAKVLHDARAAEGGFSAEMFVGTYFRERAYLRLYQRDPRRAVIDLAVMRRLHGLVPQPQVLAAEPRGVSGLPPYIVTADVEGQRADVLLDRGLPAARRQRVGAPVRAAGVGAARRPLRAARARGWTPTCASATGPSTCARLQAWFEHLEPGLAAAGLGRRSTPGLRPLVRAASQRLASAGERPASLVHGDLNGKNLVVDPHTGRLRAVLDWEYSHAGDWAEDVGNLLRGADQGAAAGGAGAASWTAFRRGLVDALHAGLHERGTTSTAGFDDDWLHRAVDLDLFALLELAARPERGASAPAPVALARQLLRARAQSRSSR